jgi:hypothetical protein
LREVAFRVSVREFLLENFAGDLEYHPRRAAIYLVLAVGAGCFWIFSPAETKFTTAPLVFALGSLTLLGKGVFLLRPSSEGLGLSHAALVKPGTSPAPKTLPSIPAHAAQIVQDFGTGGLLLWPLLNLGQDIDQSWSNPPRLFVFGVGAFFFGLGWAIRHLTRRENAQG